MIELIWGILNIAILIYFIIICFKATKIIREKLGGFAALIFVFGLLSFISKPSESTKKFDFQNESKKKITFNGNTYSREKILQDNLTTNIAISVSFGENTIEKKLLNASVNRNGFVSGTDWQTTNMNINKVDNNNYKYNVSGTIDWKILGITLYTEMKKFSGKIELKK